MKVASAFGRVKKEIMGDLEALSIEVKVSSIGVVQ